MSITFECNVSKRFLFITAHLRSTREGNVFSLSVHRRKGRGYPMVSGPRFFSGGGLPMVSGSTSFPGGYPSQVLGQGFPPARTRTRVPSCVNLTPVLHSNNEIQITQSIIPEVYHNTTSRNSTIKDANYSTCAEIPSYDETGGAHKFISLDVAGDCVNDSLVGVSVDFCITTTGITCGDKIGFLTISDCGGLTSCKVNRPHYSGTFQPKDTEF